MKDKRRDLITLALLVVPFFLAPEEGPKEVWYLTIPFLVAVALVLARMFKPPFLASLPSAATGPGVGGFASLVFVAVSVMRGSASFPVGLVFIYGTFRFVKDAYRRGELGPFDPALPLRGWPRRALLVGVALGMLNFISQWTGDFKTSYTTNYDYSGYSTTYTYANEGRNAWATGDATVPGILLVLIVLWAAYRGPWRPSWWRWVPTGLAVVLMGVLLQKAIADNRYVQELYEIGGNYAQFQAPGPTWGLILSLPLCVGAVVLGLKGAEPPVASEPQTSAPEAPGMAPEK